MNMTKNRIKIENRLMPAYLLIETCLLIIIKITERQGHEGIDIDNIFMFLTTLLGAAVALYYYFRYGKNREDRHENLLVIAAVITAFADLFLSLIDTYSASIPGLRCSACWRRCMRSI